VVGGQAGHPAAAAGAHQAAAAADGAVDGEAAAAPEPHGGPNSSSSNTTGSWVSPWELYPAGNSAEEAVAAEHSPGLDAEQVIFTPYPTGVLLQVQIYLTVYVCLCSNVVILGSGCVCLM
jgi:hypothetical protein